MTKVRHQRGFRKYTDEQLRNALNDIRRGKSARQAAASYGLPFSTLLSCSKTVTCAKKKMGPAPRFLVYEDLLIDWIFEMQRRRLPISAIELLSSIRKIVQVIKIDMKLPD